MKSLQNNMNNTTKLIKVDSSWSDGMGKKFHIIKVAELDGYLWIHYKQDRIVEHKEFSCYLESFLERFTEVSE